MSKELKEKLMLVLVAVAVAVGVSFLAHQGYISQSDAEAIKAIPLVEAPSAVTE